MTNAQWNHFASTFEIVCWAVFLVVWMLGALYNARRAPAVRKRGWLPQRWSIAPVVVVVVLVNRHLPKDTWEPLTVHAQWIRVAGAAVLVAAMAFTFWARWKLGLMWTSAPAAKEGHELRTDGPYAIVRHPIYTGILGMFVGTALLNQLGGWLLALVVVAVLVRWKLSAEERLMTEAFPDEYEEYKRRVPRLVPLPGPRRPRGEPGRPAGRRGER
jgi:protein-S-isoprenylcysteine O-methyltransferase Ste14